MARSGTALGGSAKAAPPGSQGPARTASHRPAAKLRFGCRDIFFRPASFPIPARNHGFPIPTYEKVTFCDGTAIGKNWKAFGREFLECERKPFTRRSWEPGIIGGRG